VLASRNKRILKLEQITIASRITLWLAQTTLNQITIAQVEARSRQRECDPHRRSFLNIALAYGKGPVDIQEAWSQADVLVGL
jgi:hypothetical protein